MALRSHIRLSVFNIPLEFSTITTFLHPPLNPHRLNERHKRVRRTVRNGRELHDEDMQLNIVKMNISLEGLKIAATSHF